MKFSFSRIIPLSLILALLISLIPSPVYAATITSVVPGQIVNDVSTTITVNGTGFSVGSAVVLLNGAALSTSVVNDSVLTATVPAGLAAGSYTVTVSNGVDPDTSCANCLMVLAPTPIPPTAVPTATTAPLPFVRPQLVVKSIKTNNSVQTNGDFRLVVIINNAGSADAYSVQAAFTSSDLVPTKNGGVSALGSVGAGGGTSVGQTFRVTAQLFGQSFVVTDLTLTYYDSQGTTYTEKFTLSIPASGGGSSGVVVPTTTPTGVKSSQLVITGYSSSVDPLQPGEQFLLKMTVQNTGNARAQRITMIVGGGSSGTSGGTPQPGGVSGGSGEFTNFAPVGASNVQSLGDLEAGGTVEASQNLIVNVSTDPGAYPMKITFSYLNDKGEVINDEQVITLLVYSLPNVDVSFYRPPDPFFAGQPGALPFQVVNLGKRLAVLGNMKVEASNGFIENGTSLVGSLDAGGYFTLDSMLTPEQSGTLTLSITIDYTDDFNQARTIKRTMEIEVMEGFIEPTPDPSAGGGGGEVPVPSEESVLQKIWRFILGVLGLDSAPPSNSNPGDVPQFEQPLPLPAPGGGKG